VCRNDVVRQKVNDLLATGASYAFIVRTLGDDNAKLDNRDRITFDSIRNHAARHFPVQQVAKATYRDILERRTQQNAVDFVEGVATALLPVTFFEIVMNIAFPRMVDDETEVSVATGLRAAEKLQSFLDRHDQADVIAEMKRRVNQLTHAVKSTVPEAMWGAIVDKVDQLEPQSQALDAETEMFEDDESYDPIEIGEEDDEF
jgi:hypothetical protein